VSVSLFRPYLFQRGSFVLRSGLVAPWKIECDALTPADWAALALMASEVLPPFGVAEGVPRGGLPFADAMREHSRACSVGFPHPPHDWCRGAPLPLLICEDVVTTGGSMERHRAGRDAIGVCVFARGPVPPWVTPLFQMTRPRGEKA
jgi:hypothetical protein